MNWMKGGFVKMDGRIVIGVLLLGILALGGYLFLSGEDAVVSAQGTAVIETKPDLISVYFDIEKRNESAEVAQDELEKASDAVLIEMFRLGFERADVQLLNYNIYPEYDWSDGARKILGYAARQQIVVKNDDYTLVPRIVDRGVGAGGYVTSINFELSEDKQNEYKAQVLEAAGGDAQRKATATASGLGKKLGDLVSVESQDFQYPGPIMYYEKAFAVADAGAAESARSAAIAIAPRDIEVRATILVKYKLRRF